jgi:hypothetical protein
MAGAVGAAARGAIEADERVERSAVADSAGAQGVEGDRSEGRDMGPCGFSQGEGGGRGATTAGSRGEGLIAGRVALYPSSLECPAFMIEEAMSLEMV